MISRHTIVGLASAAGILAIGIGGMLKLGGFHWGVFAATVAGAAFVFVSQRNRSRFREQFPKGLPRKF